MAKCKVTYQGQCRHPPSNMVMWMGSDPRARTQLCLYCEGHRDMFLDIKAIKVLKKR